MENRLVKKKSGFMAILIVLSLGTPILSDDSSLLDKSTKSEIVRNLKGELILLNDDGTWSKYQNKNKKYGIAFSIQNAFNYYKEYSNDDGFGNQKYSYYLGCAYKVRVENNTEFIVNINSFFLQSTDPFFSNYLTDYHDVSHYSFGKLPLKPGENVVTGVGIHASQLGKWYYKDFQNPLEKVEIEELLWTYGCEAQKGSIYMTEKFSGGFYIVKFEPKAKISNKAARNFAYTLDEYVPLQRHIRIK